MFALRRALCGSVLLACIMFPQTSFAKFYTAYELKDFFDDDEAVSLHYLEAPFREAEWGQFFGDFHVYHAGISMVGSSGKTLSCEFSPRKGDYSPLSVVLPVIVNDTYMYWDSDMTIWCRDSVQSHYWKKDTLVGSGKGAQINSVLYPWLESWNATNSRYNLFMVWDGYGKQLLLNSTTCYDFVLEMFQAMRDRGAVFDQSKEIRRDYINIISTSIKRVPFANPPDRKAILHFYMNLELYEAEGFWGDLLDVMAFFKGNKYHHTNDDSYYLLDPIFPYLSLHYDIVKLPT